MSLLAALKNNNAHQAISIALLTDPEGALRSNNSNSDEISIGVGAIISRFTLQASARFWDRRIPGAHTQLRHSLDPIQSAQSFSQFAPWHAIWLFEFAKESIFKSSRASPYRHRARKRDDGR
jgi:hypothetical protein